MANKKKYDNAKQKAWYADERAVEVLDVLREEKRKELGTEKEITRSTYINELLIKLGIERGIIKQTKTNASGTTPEMKDIKARLDELQEMFKKFGGGDDSKRGASA